MPAVVHGRNLVTDPLLMISDSLGPKLFDADEDPDTITDFLDAHLLEDQLITLYQIASGNVVDPE